ncbi:hypothetical protein [Paraburkholderia caribensis]|uniref:hypothetical protein n=1 Tax=Paraburkholderia caribensis TaxID=75105 RepID=UPI0015914ED0|nr:hypothetical protein [Paraburkholderia caribensis]
MFGVDASVGAERAKIQLLIFKPVLAAVQPNHPAPSESPTAGCSIWTVPSHDHPQLFESHELRACLLFPALLNDHPAGFDLHEDATHPFNPQHQPTEIGVVVLAPQPAQFGGRGGGRNRGWVSVTSIVIL